MGYTRVMAIFVRQDEERTQLQERIAAELRERSKQNASSNDLPDGVSDSQYMKGTKQTSSLGWLWILVGLVAAGVVFWLAIISSH